ncbi:SMP-30/gluconolactonase/LRE family protein [Janthinobacterium agaricidamnosum]|uniref:SMP-30/Gluconolaconase/LRE-like region family protein n=1 Tax=Janthinobacterium agaricidamnosum NBRC 102515 = DSM 9628 TaxID=1349767 RepID=W0V2Z5_9BURK|nr:SMP-30/gluconolactonase/LRE family protein [Janthinobacterium agaricidamnosum]CDG81940.1 SMP-30/Gluconolaconase/LRE-like region family protein [Janthinobacterium agaricidamnosum NBRC 102515 = DSM 9628]
MTINEIKVVSDSAMQVGESPLWLAKEAALYWVDIDGKAVHRLDTKNGKHQQWTMPSEPSALARHSGGGLVVALRSGFARLDTATGNLTPLTDAPYDTATTRFNDGKVDPAGRFWVGTIYEPRSQPAAEMFVLEKGKIRKAWSGGMTVSNGLGFSPDGTSLYHADTTTHRIDRYDFNPASGALGPAASFQRFSTDKANHYGGRPDGAAVDSQGNYWCAMFEGGRVLQIAPNGDILNEIALPLRCPTMVAFGGPDLRTLYITSASHNRSAEEKAQYPLTGRVLSVRVDVAGREEPPYIG